MKPILLAYLRTLSVSQKDELAHACNTSIGYIRKACSKGQLLSPERCVLIEQISQGVVTRKDLRPDDWHLIWPEKKQDWSMPLTQGSTN
ncbi:transcriptional regulator [Ferrovum myxofaciens]|jgi:DNA-binding transcriptional regulator YdaS (Cro superfamily)|uniref:transcriptional regulator n=1 Tax=Ferrovum myxofaciens TaxID=416213 RepID=UPI000A001241|nr:YdaS family helix-turn-helix protein [Ferrovum myxofaciens]MBU6993538.1 helix-turn-helix domain-containing protein [Ferrovum myxofaciens]QKE40035.1 MAG: Cro/Cl family transcriptional regulator [Ferrovum myxofaciens]